jgi:redox-sensing transcriptional repressor
VLIDKNLSYFEPTKLSTQPVISQASLGRLPQYHHYLVELADRGVSQVSGTVIGRRLNCVPVQVRKDLQYTGVVGRTKAGYSVAELIRAIETFLGWNNVNEAFLAGAGSLGAALLGYEKFSKYGLRIVGAFDTDPNKIGRSVHEREVLPLHRLGELARRMSIHLGIITVPAEAAQEVADEMVKGGIEAIWNFAPLKLEVPEHICVQNEDLYSSLASLVQKLSR